MGSVVTYSFSLLITTLVVEIGVWFASTLLAGQVRSEAINTPNRKQRYRRELKTAENRIIRQFGTWANYSFITGDDPQKALSLTRSTQTLLKLFIVLPFAFTFSFFSWGFFFKDYFGAGGVISSPAAGALFAVSLTAVTIEDAGVCFTTSCILPRFKGKKPFFPRARFLYAWAPSAYVLILGISLALTLFTVICTINIAGTADPGSIVLIGAGTLAFFFLALSVLYYYLLALALQEARKVIERSIEKSKVGLVR